MAKRNKNYAFEEHFEDFGVHLTEDFDLAEFAMIQALEPNTLSKLLMNLEDQTIMEDIASGVYNTFNPDECESIEEDWLFSEDESL